MKKLIRKILLKMIDAPDCGTPFIQMGKENKIIKSIKRTQRSFDKLMQ